MGAVLRIAMVLVFFTVSMQSVADGKKMHYIHWNRANPMFRLDNTDHIVEVNSGNLPWEYDQVNVICPVSKPGVQYPERHVIYSVSREEFDSCRITNPKPKIVAICNKPHRLMYFTITFRSFTPTPGGLEFHPGQDYYFISTSSREDLHRRVGGGCSTHNMKMIFKVADNRGSTPNDADDDTNAHPHINQPRFSVEDNSIADHSVAVATTTPTSTTSHRPVYRYNSKVPSMRGGDYVYYYHPKDLVELESNDLYNSRRRKNKKTTDRFENEIWKNEALRYTSSAAASISSLSLVVLALLTILCCSKQV